MRRIKCPNESFFDKSLRYANAGIAGIGTMRGLYETGQSLYSGARMVGAALGPAATAAAAIL